METCIQQMTLSSDLMNIFGISITIANKIINHRPSEETPEENQKRLSDLFILCMVWKMAGFHEIGENAKPDLLNTIYLSEISGKKLLPDGKSIFDLLMETEIDKTSILYLGSRLTLLERCGYLRALREGGERKNGK